MAFTPLDPNVLKVGDPITADIANQIRTNFDDHETRINSLATSGGTVFIFNQMVSFVGYSPSNPYVMYYLARQDFSVNDFRAQLRSKQGITSGTLSFRLEKSTDTNDANFASILTADLTFNFATDAEHSIKVASINSSLNEIFTGEVLRVKVMGLPTNAFGYNYSGEVLMSVGAQ